jgi:hypothetical protein
MITRAQRLCWFTILFNKQLKQISLIQQPRQTGKKQYFQRSTQKVFVGPHFWLTKHYLNMVRKVGVLQLFPP